jgi:hypothetical protein
MATFTIQKARKNSIYVIVTKNNGDTFGLTIRDEQLEDGDLAALLKQIKRIVRATVKTQNIPDLTALASLENTPTDDSDPEPSAVPTP